MLCRIAMCVIFFFSHLSRRWVNPPLCWCQTLRLAHTEPHPHSTPAHTCCSFPVHGRGIRRTIYIYTRVDSPRFNIIIVLLLVVNYACVVIKLRPFSNTACTYRIFGATKYSIIESLHHSAIPLVFISIDASLSCIVFFDKFFNAFPRNSSAASGCGEFLFLRAHTR